MANIASRSFLVGALLRHAVPTQRHPLFSFLRGLSQGELECLADFQGALILESQTGSVSAYRLMEEFFQQKLSLQCKSAEEKAHKSYVLLTYLDCFQASPVQHKHSPEFNPA